MDKDSFEIDQNRLNWECVRQPKLYLKYAEELAEAKQALEEAKTALEVIKADLSLSIRKDPDTYGLDKITEAVVSSTITLQQKCIEQNQEVIDKKYDVDMLQSAVITLDHRKRMIESLVTLHGQNYFSSPNINGEAGEHLKEEKKRLARRRRRKV